MIPEFEVEGYKIFSPYAKNEESGEGYDYGMLYMKPEFCKFINVKHFVKIEFVTAKVNKIKLIISGFPIKND